MATVRPFAIVSEATVSFTDVTTNNASTTKHGFLLKLDNSSTNFLNGQGAWAAPAASVTGFTSSQNTSSPNNTVNASQLLVSAASTNADFVLTPKGTGAILAQVPNSLSSGGDKRGDRAVDLQTLRNTSSKVASGYLTTICGGKSNTASGRASVVSGGYGNSCTNYYTSCCGGKGNTVSGKYSTCGGGYQNTVSGGTYAKATVGGGRGNTASNTGAVVSGGYFNTAGGVYSSVLGGKYGTTRGLYGCSSIASGRFATTGDAQCGQSILRGLTTDATPKVLTANQGAASTTNQCIIPNNSCYTFIAKITAHRTDTVSGWTHRASWIIEGAVARDANAASTIVTSATTTITNTPAWTIAAAADTTNGGVNFTFTGEASKTIRTVVVLETCEVTS